MRLELSRRAQADLDDIRDYGADRYGTERAIQYLDAVEAAFRRLLDHPAIGVDRSDLADRLRSYPVGEHRIYYASADDRIVVERVLHKAMDVERHL